MSPGKKPPADRPSKGKATEAVASDAAGLDVAGFAAGSALSGEAFARLEALLPWYASGQLDEAARGDVERALQRDEVLRQRLALVREEMSETVYANEDLGAPSSRTFARMMERIDAEPEMQAASAKATGSASGSVQVWKTALTNLVGKIDDVFAGLTPQTMRLGAGLAAVLILVQAGVIGAGYFGNQPSRYVSASGDAASPALSGTFALVKFSDDAKAGDIAALLRRLDANIVAGPKPGGIYRVRLSAKAVPEDARGKLMAALRKHSALVELVLPAGAK